MSKEKALIDKVRVKIGDEELRFAVSAGAELAGVIHNDICTHWENWVEVAARNVNASGQTISPRMALAAVLIAQAVEALPERARMEGRSQFEALCGTLFDLEIEAREAKFSQ